MSGQLHSRETLRESLGGLLAAEGAGSAPLRVAFPTPLAEHAQKLLSSLGVVIVIDPKAPRLTAVPPASGRSAKTRRELGEEVRQRQREAYYARPDKKHLLRDGEND